MTELVIYRGLPGSGKTTIAKAWVANDPAARARVNRDDLRAMAHDSVFLGQDTERQIQSARDATIVALLKRGISVASDDTNLPQRTARDLAKLARLNGAEVQVVDLTGEPIDLCLARDAARERTVGEDVIRGMHKRYLAGRKLPLPLPEESEGGDAAEPYVPKPGTPSAIMVDIDGTAALIGTRSPYDDTRVHEDRLNEPVAAAVRAFHYAGTAIIFCSGRSDVCREATEYWLAKHGLGFYEAVLMRSAGDMRKDSVVKLELFDRHIRNRYNIQLVLDDRQQVVDAWRSIGLTVFQVAPGNF